MGRSVCLVVRPCPRKEANATLSPDQAATFIDSQFSLVLLQMGMERSAKDVQAGARRSAGPDPIGLKATATAVRRSPGWSHKISGEDRLASITAQDDPLVDSAPRGHIRVMHDVLVQYRWQAVWQHEIQLKSPTPSPVLEFRFASPLSSLMRISSRWPRKWRSRRLTRAVRRLVEGHGCR